MNDAQGGEGPAEGPPPAAPRRLRVLCLHGFRQTGSGLKGRSAALRKRLRHLPIDWVFLDAPHRLPPLAKAALPAGEGTKLGPAAGEAAEPVATPKRGWLLLPEQYSVLQQQPEQQLQEGIGKRGQQPALEFDEHQYSKQTAGWAESWDLLQCAIQEQGPFDGVLGFSQGAAVAAVLCALLQEQQWRQQQQRLRPQQEGLGLTKEGPLEGRACGSGSGSGSAEVLPPLCFAILISGYISAPPQHQALLAGWGNRGGIPMPSLHIFGAEGYDRQVATADSRQLAECFAPRLATVVQHSGGHLVPSDRGTGERVRDFLAGLPGLT